MLRTMMTSKIHRATVTQADLHYVGSVTVDADLLDAADLLPGELVHIVDVTNGARLETYTIAGERGSGVLGINGAAAHLVHPGDLVILIAYGQMDDRRGAHPPAPRRLRRRRQPGARHRLRPRRGRARLRPGARRPRRRAMTTTLLCADIGNSHTTLGVVADGEVLDHWRVATDERRTSDEWAVLVRGLLRESPVGSRVEGVALCATVPAVLHEWRDMLLRHYESVPRVVVEPGVRTGVPVLMDNPREVGADRIVNALAAATLYGGPAIVVDFGTATTFDVVSPRGEYVGGAIAPGIDISLEALGRRGAQLRKVELLAPAHRDRQEHRRGAPVRDGLRLRQPGRRHRGPDDRRARRHLRAEPRGDGARDRHRRPRAGRRRRVPRDHRPPALADAARPASWSSAATPERAAPRGTPASSPATGSARRAVF